MKKLFITLVICMLVIGSVVFLTKSENLYNKIVEIFESDELQISDIQNKSTMYWYDTLNDNEQRIYRIIANGVENLDDRLTIAITKETNIEILKKEIDAAINAYFSDSPEVFYVSSTYEIVSTNMLVANKVDLKLEYISKDTNEITRMQQDLETEINKVYNIISKYGTDYQKELYAHDILAKEIVYFEHDEYNEIPDMKHTAYSALVEKSAVCDGITKAFQLILSRSGIESVFVTGVTENTPHAWCKVKLDNEYYNVDVTSDKVLNKENNELIVHAYFNITDEEIKNTHEIDNYEKLPKSDTDKYNYYIYNDYEISYFDSLEYKLGKIVKAQSNNALLEFRVSGITNIAEKMVNALYNINFNNYRTNNTNKIEYNKINDNYIIVK